MVTPAESLIHSRYWSDVTVTCSGQDGDSCSVPDPLQVLVDACVDGEPAIGLTRLGAVADKTDLQGSEWILLE